MARKLASLFVTAAVLGGLAVATTGFAEETAPLSRPAQAEGPSGHHGGMMNATGRMSPDQTKEAARMVDNCNRMMESMSNAPAGPDKEGAPATHG